MTIAPDILAQLGAFDQYCNVYAPSPHSSVFTCATRHVAIKVKAGQVVGTARGVVPLPGWSRGLVLFGPVGAGVSIAIRRRSLRMV